MTLFLIGLLASWSAAAAPGQTAGSPGQPSQPGLVGQPATSQPELMLEVRRLRVELTAPARPAATTAPAVLALGGSTASLAVEVKGEPNAAGQWQVAFGQTVIQHGAVALNGNGDGRFLLNLTDVRVRTNLKLVITQGKLAAACDLVILPAARLAEVAQQIRSLELGVIDDRGGLQAALRAEGVEFENLSTRLLADAFKGGAVMLAGFADSPTLTEVCHRLEERIRNGMTVVVFNPPAGWRQWDIAASRAGSVLAGPVVLAEGGEIGVVVEPADLGAGPWEMGLDLGESWDRLAWVQAKVPDKDGQAVEQVLVAVRRLGDGRVAVVQLGPMGDPLTCPEESEILDEMVLWMLGKPAKVATTQTGGSQ